VACWAVGARVRHAPHGRIDTALDLLRVHGVADDRRRLLPGGGAWAPPSGIGSTTPSVALSARPSVRHERHGRGRRGHSGCDRREARLMTAPVRPVRPGARRLRCSHIRHVTDPCSSRGLRTISPSNVRQEEGCAHEHGLRSLPASEGFGSRDTVGSATLPRALSIRSR